MKLSKIQFTLVILFMGLLIFPNNTFSQQDKNEKHKVVIIKKTIDKDGNEKIEKTVKEGDEAKQFDVEKFLDKDKKEAKEKNVEVTVEGDEVTIIEDGEKRIIKLEDHVQGRTIKFDDGKHIEIIKTEDGELNVEELLEEIEIDAEEGEKEIRIIKTKKGNGALFGVMIDPLAEGLKLLDVVKESPAEKANLKKGDILRSINEYKLSSYEELTEVLSKYKPEDIIVVTYDRDGELRKARAVLADAKSIPMEKMIWKTDDGEEIEIEGKEFHFEEKEEDNGKKKIKKRIIIKKERE